MNSELKNKYMNLDISTILWAIILQKKCHLAVSNWNKK